MSNVKSRILVISMLFIGLFLLVAWKVGLFCSASSENGARVISKPEFSNLLFRIDFTAAQPTKKYRLDIAPQSAFVPLPGSTATISVVDSASGTTLPGLFHSTSNGISHEGSSLTFSIPSQEGAYSILFTYPDLPPVKLTCLVPLEVQNPASGLIDGINIGAYPNPARGIERVSENSGHYIPPKYFVRMQGNEDYMLSPSIKVGNLVCPTSKEKPEKHVGFAPLDYGLLFKVELGWQMFSKKHPEIPRWKFISWYRSPIHNKREGGSSYSRHIYGDALDIIVDLDDDWRMDDINHDGRVDMKDALEIGRVFEELEIAGTIPWGGVGTYEYPGDESMGAAVHIDVRGHWSRWGYSWMSGRKKNIIWYAKEPK